jgi:tetratricopeptide (TPR) repeat protein
MLDPVTVLSALAFAVARKSGADPHTSFGLAVDTLTTMLGNVAGNSFTGDIQKIRKSFVTLTQPDQNEDLERALARSALHASLFCVMEALGEPMKPPAGRVAFWRQCAADRVPKQLKDLLRSSKGFLADADRAQLLMAKDLCEQLLSRVEKRKFTRLDIDRRKLFVTLDKDYAAKSSAKALAAIERRCHGQLPAPAREIFILKWFGYLCGSFHYEIKHDQPVAHILLQISLEEFREEARAHKQQIVGVVKETAEKVIAAITDNRPPPGPVWNIPQPTRHFHDRPDLIAQIDQALEQHGVTALTALHGLGGIGKTQLARRFAQLRRAQYKLGAWIEAESEADILSALAGLAPLLGVKAEQDQQATVDLVPNALPTREHWLLIFDNADSPGMLRPYVERLSGNGHVLITSRNQQWDDLAARVSVTEWSVEESAAFLLDRTGQTDRIEAEALAKDLGGLVLALEHAAAYMRLGDGTPLTEYRRIWRERLKQEVKGHVYDKSVAATLGLSLDRVETESPVAYDLLCLFAWLAPDRIPRKELLEAGASKLPEALRSALADGDKWNHVIETLVHYSLLKLLRQPAEGPVNAYSVHRVVQQVSRDRQAAALTNAKWLAAASDLVSAALPLDADEPPFWEASEALLPHARILREHVRGVDPPASLGRLLSQASLYLRVRGLYAEARDFRELALESALRRFGPDQPELAVYRSNLAHILRELGEYGEARKQIELALELALRQFGPDHPNVAVHRSNLAATLGNLGELEEARKQIELALESDLRQLGSDHPNVALRRSNLAGILSALGEHGEARQQIELALESNLRQLGPDHPNAEGTWPVFCTT